MRTLSGLALAMICLLPGSAAADESRLSFGGDQYVAGQAASVSSAVERDAFAAGYDVSLSAPVTGDAHLAGFNVASDNSITGNLYAAGSSVNVRGAVGGDVTAFANSITIDTAAPVTGNVRLAGASVRLSGPVSGSALVAAQTVTLDTTIAGDFSFYGNTLSFGPGAKVTGKLSIQAPSEIAVPDSVASADRVSYSPLAMPDYAGEAGKTAEHVVRGIWPAVWATGIWWLLLAVAGLLFITVGSRLVATIEIAGERRRFRNLGIGLLGFATVVGLVPVFALTLIGIVVLPVVLIFVAVSSALAYLAGLYLVGVQAGGRLLNLDSKLKRFAALVAAIIVAGLLGMIPIAGWFITLTLTIFGFGAFGVFAMVCWSAGDVPRLTASAVAARMPASV